MNVLEVNVFDWYKNNYQNEDFGNHVIDIAEIDRCVSALKYQQLERDGAVSAMTIKIALACVNAALVDVLLDERIGNSDSDEPMSHEEFQNVVADHMENMIAERCEITQSKARRAYLIVAEELSRGWFSRAGAIPPMDLIASSMAVDLVEDDYKASGLLTPDMNTKYRLKD